MAFLCLLGGIHSISIVCHSVILEHYKIFIYFQGLPIKSIFSLFTFNFTFLAIVQKNVAIFQMLKYARVAYSGNGFYSPW